jgi:hypothetical protein
MDASSPVLRAAVARGLFVVATVLAAVGHLFALLLYWASGLGAPMWAVWLLLVWWLVLTFIGVRLVLRTSYLMLLVPIVAVATQVGVMSYGQYVLGWMP